MRKGTTTTVILMVLALLVSCSEFAPTATGTVSFNGAVSKAVSGTIQYHEISDVTWKLTATKVSGNSYGACDNIPIDPTTYSGEFAVGAWTFCLDGYYQSTKVYSGSVNATVSAGNNPIALSVSACGETGRLVLRNYEIKADMNITAVKISINSVMVDIVSVSNNVLNFTYATTPGVHSVDLVFLENAQYPNNGAYLESFRVRIVGGHDTEVTKMSDGTVGISISITHEAAIVD